VRQGTLYAVPFNLDRLEVTGTAVPVIENVMQATNAGADFINTWAAQFGVSGSGTLAYVPGGAYPDPEYSFIWVDHQGTVQPLTEPVKPYFAPRLSPDGRRVVYCTLGKAGESWLYEIDRGSERRLTFGEKDDWPVWTPDGKRVTFVRTEKSYRSKILLIPTDGSTEAQSLYESDDFLAVGSWSPTGNLLAFVQGNPDSKYDIWVLSTEERKAKPFVKTKFRETYPEFSPDGRYLAYASDESGQTEVYVRPYPGPGEIVRISTEGGDSPCWAPTGRELFYLTTGTMAVDLTTGRELNFGKPRLLWGWRLSNRLVIRGYDIHPDGRRFLTYRMKERPEGPGVTQIHIVQNWFEELKRLCPTGK
jgi:serine/threonine-protein kinase